MNQERRGVVLVMVMVNTFKGAALAAGAGAALEAGLEKTEAWKGSVKFQKQ